MKNSITAAIFALMIINTSNANEWACKEEYETFTKRFEENSPMRDRAYMAGAAIYVPAVAVGAFVVLAPLTGGLSLMAAPIVSMGSYAGIHQIINAGELRVDAYRLLSEADFTQEQLDQNYKKSIFISRQNVIDDSINFNKAWAIKNKEEKSQSRPALTKELMIDYILNSPINKRPEGMIEGLRTKLSRKLDRELTYDQVRAAILEVRESPTLCEKKKPAKYKTIQRAVKEVLLHQ